MKIAATVVLYKPNISEVAENICTYAEKVSEVIIVNNTENGSELSVLQSRLSHTILVQNNKNLGIAKALNQACAQALHKGYEWLLTMDQDSSFETDQIERYMELVQKCKNSSIAVFSLAHDRRIIQNDPTASKYVIAAITSGSVMNLKVWKEAGGFNETLFIDEVDHEYCYRVNLLNYKVLLFEGLFLNHKLGVQKEVGYLGSIAKTKRTIHNPERLYYMVRNFLFVKKKYEQWFPAEFKQRKVQILITIKNNLLFSGRFFASLRAVIKGYSDYRKLK